MGSKKHAEKLPQQQAVEDCAAEVMETVPMVIRFIRADMRARKATELSVPQFRTLAFLDRHPESSLSDLANHLGVTRATASANVERLVQRGFVDRCDDPKERRRVALKLTDDGRAHLLSARHQTRAYIAELLGCLSLEQVAQVEKGLELLRHVFEQLHDLVD